MLSLPHQAQFLKALKESKVWSASHVRWMFNAGGGHVSGGVHDGNILLFQTRVGVDF